jgi:hypothetical protein
MHRLSQVSLAGGISSSRLNVLPPSNEPAAPAALSAAHGCSDERGSTWGDARRGPAWAGLEQGPTRARTHTHATHARTQRKKCTHARTHARNARMHAHAHTQRTHARTQRVRNSRHVPVPSTLLLTLSLLLSARPSFPPLLPLSAPPYLAPPPSPRRMLGLHGAGRRVRMLDAGPEPEPARRNAVRNDTRCGRAQARRPLC